MLILKLIYFKCQNFLELQEIFYNYFNLMVDIFMFQRLIF